MTEQAIDVPSNDACAFCDYLRGSRPYVFLWKEPEVAVAVTREQRGISHLLVLPTQHTETLLDLRESPTEPLMIALRDAARTIDAADERPGISVWQNNGVPAGQAIAHLHFHVAGTLAGGGTEFGEVSEISLDAAAQIADRLSAHVPQNASSSRSIWGRERGSA